MFSYLTQFAGYWQERAATLVSWTQRAILLALLALLIVLWNTWTIHRMSQAHTLQPRILIYQEVEDLPESTVGSPLRPPPLLLDGSYPAAIEE